MLGPQNSIVPSSGGGLSRAEPQHTQWLPSGCLLVTFFRDLPSIVFLIFNFPFTSARSFRACVRSSSYRTSDAHDSSLYIFPFFISHLIPTMTTDGYPDRSDRPREHVCVCRKILSRKFGVFFPHGLTILFVCCSRCYLDYSP